MPDAVATLPMRHELVTMGRVGVDLYPLRSGVTLAEATTFRKMLGGSPTNVAVAAARLGRRTAVITKVGDDPFGAYVRQALAGFGVDPSFVGTEPGLRTPLAFCELHPPEDFPLLFYREPTAPDLCLRSEELDLDAIRAAEVLWTTGTGLCRSPSREATLAAMDARPAGAPLVHDLDHRPMFWDTVDEAGRCGREAVRRATVVVGNADEAAVVVGAGAPEELAERLLALGPQLAIVKLGSRGVLGATAAGERVRVAPIAVDVVNGLGAGDAFGGALAHGLLAGDPLPTVLRRANAAGAIVAGRLGCADDMPTLDEVDATTITEVHR